MCDFEREISIGKILEEKYVKKMGLDSPNTFVFTELYTIINYGQI